MTASRVVLPPEATIPDLQAVLEHRYEPVVEVVTEDGSFDIDVATGRTLR